MSTLNVFITIECSESMWTPISVGLMTIRWCRARSYPAIQCHISQYTVPAKKKSLMAPSWTWVTQCSQAARWQGLTFQQNVYRHLVFDITPTIKSATFVQLNLCRWWRSRSVARRWGTGLSGRTLDQNQPYLPIPLKGNARVPDESVLKEF